MHKFSLGEPEKHDESNRPWYDTKKGIEESLTSLKKLLELVQARHKAGYQDDERLNEFYILGRYSTDSCGNFGKVDKPLMEIFPELPKVLTRDEFWDYIKENSPDGERFHISVSMESGLPHVGIECPVCNNGWTIENCHDTVVRHKTESFPLTDFVGKELRQVKLAYAVRTDAVYRMQSDILIRHDRFIDKSLKYPNTEKDWEKEIVKNETGWVSERDGITDDYVIQEGDEGFFNVWTFLHKDCNRTNLAETEEARFKDIFEKAGFDSIEMTGIPNQYWQHDFAAPWFNVQTEFGTIVIGWRKRVINIDWSDVIEKEKEAKGKAPNIISLFGDEEVTKGQNGIHAWSWEKAENYLSAIRSKLAA